jgi:Fe-S-cluster-containing hydrogenase component 2
MSCADVCLSHDVDDMASFYHEKIVKAKKGYECEECRDVIPVGALYERVTGKWDGHFQTIRTCGPCAEIRKAFVCGSWALGYLWESMWEEMFPVWREKGAWDCLAKLTTPEAVAKCNVKYADWLGDDDDAE